MIVVNIETIISVIIFALIFIVLIIYEIIKAIKKIGKKNCYECRYYKLYDVCSCGDGERYICTKKIRIDNVVDSNCREHYEKCKIGAIIEKNNNKK